MQAPPPPVRTAARGWRAAVRALTGAQRRAQPRRDVAMPLLQHLEELRYRLLMALAALAGATVLCFALAAPMVAFLAQPVGGLQQLVAIDVTENAAVFMRVALLGGVALAMPVMAYQGLRFVLPAVTAPERRWLLAAAPAAALLFVAGAAFAWFVLVPAALPFLTGFLGIRTQLRPQSYFAFVTRLAFWMGLSFELPLAVFVLARGGLVTAAQMLRGWRYALVAVAVLASVATPTVDPVNMGLMMLPLLTLYALSVGVAACAGRR